MHIRANLFPFSFFLSDRISVSSLDSAAREHGGATQNMMTGEIWSNVPGSEYITLNKKENVISIFIPSTVDVNREDMKKQREIFQHVMNRIEARYSLDAVTVDPARGSWWSEDRQEVVYDDILLVSVRQQKMNISDIWFFVKLANYIKREMAQEGVSIALNNALAIV